MRAAPEIDVLEAVLAALFAAREAGGLRRFGTGDGGRRWIERQHVAAVVDRGGVRDRLDEAQYDARTPFRLDRRHAEQRALLDGDRPRRHADPGVGEVERDARGIADRKTLGLGGPPGGPHDDLYPVPGQLGVRDLAYFVLPARRCGGGRGIRTRGGQHRGLVAVGRLADVEATGADQQQIDVHGPAGVREIRICALYIAPRAHLADGASEAGVREFEAQALAPSRLSIS